MTKLGDYYRAHLNPCLRLPLDNGPAPKRARKGRPGRKAQKLKLKQNRSWKEIKDANAEWLAMNEKTSGAVGTNNSTPLATPRPLLWDANQGANAERKAEAERKQPQ